MKGIFRYAALLLATVMIMGSMASCDRQNDKDEDGATDEVSTSAETSVSAEGFIDFDAPEIDEYVEDLASIYAKRGETFTWCGNEGQAPEVEEDTGDLRNDALYFRQRQLEETFELNWVNFRPTVAVDENNQAMFEYVLQDVLAGVGAYDACYGTTIAIAQPLFMHNALADLSEYNYVDLEREWWTPNLMDIYGIEGSIYFLNGAIVTSNYEDTFCIAFNKEIAEDYGIDGLYDLVYNNEWTFDKMFEVASVIPSNANKSGVYRFGNAEGMTTLYAHGYRVAKFDENGTPYIDESLPNELYELSEKFSVIYGDETISAICKGGKQGHYEWVIDKYGYDDFNDMFADDQFLFYFLNTGEAADLRRHDVQFGILPIPKGSTSQENYISHTYMWGASNVFVPRSARNTELSDVMLECLAALGYKYIKPAYYDKILKTRATYDYESKGMIDIAFETKSYDIIDFLAVGGNINMESDLVRLIRGAIQEDNDAFASRYFLQAKIVSSNINMIINNIHKDQTD
ncbi:MAG: extracellular solute-binding protein [Clostridia bacterium]|nr:extracellular solute-binding protein [Clostridia bacterium]